LSHHIVRGGRASRSMLTTACSSALRLPGKRSPHEPYNPAITRPSSSTRTAAHPARLARIGAPPRMAPSLKAWPVNVKSPSGTRSPHHLVTFVGAGRRSCRIGTPCWKSGSSRVLGWTAARRTCWSLCCARRGAVAAHPQNLWCNVPRVPWSKGSSGRHARQMSSWTPRTLLSYNLD